ncbi:hypoxanthine-guanine phosphoribosyltransferase-like protein [Dinothrombium tinctorium]|nr:hypoxanthine-guanine phosphoribosyltransferase-like protein [Dinothrombium tinctorium]RWS12495.1 hypoxanthine-guanine phosphoribosyltransferase-like protein [Dinothrombium tinctorium]
MKTLEGKNVLVVEDVIDTGRSMAMFFEKLAQFNPKTSRLVCLTVKEKKTCLDFRPHYIGFVIPDRFIVGCNYEYNNYYRDLNHVCMISEEAKRKYAIDETNNETKATQKTDL